MATVAWLTVSIAGRRESPVTPAEKELTSLPKITPTAPASKALPERPAEPQRRPVPSNHFVMTILPATLAASALEKAVQPSVLFESEAGCDQSPIVTTSTLVTPGLSGQS